MNTKHTPGPWRYTKQQYSKSKSITTAYYHYNIMPIYFRSDVIDTGNGHVRANAKLIAAAPDLYFGCRAALLTLEEDENYHKYTDIINTLKQAIQKAGAE